MLYCPFSGNRNAGGYICFSMETNYSRIFFGGIAYGAYPEPGSRLVKTGLPLKRLGRDFHYLLGQGRTGAGRLQIYHALLPQYSGKTFFRGRPREWKGQTALRLLSQAAERAGRDWDCREQIFFQEETGCGPGSCETPLFESGGVQGELPAQLWAACLYRCRPFDRLCVSLDEERGEQSLSMALELLLPYLPRLRQAMYFGEESEAFLELEDYLYAEFGIVMTRVCRVPREIPWLDLRQETTGENPGPIRPLSRPGILKFLDTAVKNGYNTIVNSREK